MEWVLNPIVHIGVHKTATSWFQRHVYPYVESHSYFADRRLLRRVMQGSDALLFDAEAVRRELGLDALNKPPILCEEDLSGVLHNGLASGHIAATTARRLHALLPDAKIVIFIRAQPSAAISWYLQYLREGGTGSIRRYLFPETYRHFGHERFFKLPRFSFTQIEYRGLIETYDALFGRDRVIVVPHELLVRDRPGTLRRLGHDLGCLLPDGGGGRENSGYRRGLIPILRFANLFTRRAVVDKVTLLHLPYWYTVRKALFKQLNRSPLFGRPPKPADMLAPETLEWITQRFWRSNRWLAERTGLPLGEMGYPLDPPAVEVARPCASAAFRWARN
jgi:hypothetical protein